MSERNSDKAVREALDKKAAYGRDVDLEKYNPVCRDSPVIDDLEGSQNEFKETMTSVGISPDESLRSGTVMFIDNSMSHCSNKLPDGVEILTTKQAVKKYDWVKDLMWTAVAPEKDKFTALTYLEKSDGYFIRVKAGYKIEAPIQACMLLKSDKSIQHVHNIVVVEDGASANFITGCATGPGADEAVHIGVTESFLGDNASMDFSMIHNWGEETAVRPRTGIVVGKNSHYSNNYVILEKVGTLQSNPIVNLNGEGSTAKFNSMCIAHEGSDIDNGSVAIMNSRGTSAEIISRSIAVGGKMTARGRLVGNAPGVKAHLECKSIILKEGGSTIAIPELEANEADLEMTHEAAVGKIAREQIEYLMSRGLSEEQAVSMIVRGFLSGGIAGLPPQLEKRIREATELANLGD
ncbi:MAG: SufB/SufD family protein [Candidatus Methanomethylophilaceae archaeon]|jgi:Fe-S cluster assembly scaffold protein SufB